MGQSRTVYRSLIVWLVIALVIGGTRLLIRSPVPPPLIAFGLTAVVLALLVMVPKLRRQVREIGVQPLVALHLVRIAAGGYFLVLWSRGVLPGEFAIAAGVGDILVGLGAGFVLWKWVPILTPRERRGVLAWNVIGLADILLVLGNGMRLFRGSPDIAVPFTSLPLALLPTFIVPLVIVSHVLLFPWGRPERET